MATVHIGRLLGPVGFSRTVAIKRLHPNFSKDPEFVSMFLDEARLAARIRHPNVVSILDVVAMNSELLLVMDYIAGESLARLLLLEQRRGNRVPLDIVAKIMTEVLSGLHAAHEVTSDRGMHLGVVHRDVSPQNILVGQDGISHLIDFGVAKAAGRMHTTQNGQIKGKLAYMAPEQIVSEDVDRRVDIYASGIVLWEALTGRRAYKGADPQIMFEVLASNLPPPSEIVPGISPALDALVMKALAREPAGRFATALEMSDAIEALVRPATSREVARWVEQIAADSLQKRAQVLADVEGVTQVSSRYEAPPLDDDPHPELPQARFAAFAPSPQVPEDQLPTRFLPRNEPVSGDLQQSAAEQTVVPSVIVTGKGPETPFDATTSRLDRPKKNHLFGASGGLVFAAGGGARSRDCLVFWPIFRRQLGRSSLGSLLLCQRGSSLRQRLFAARSFRCPGGLFFRFSAAAAASHHDDQAFRSARGSG